MGTDFLYYIFCIIVLVVAFFVLKKVAGCLIKSIVMAVLLAVLAFIYFKFFR
jgi:hypothetical protein